MADTPLQNLPGADIDKPQAHTPRTRSRFPQMSYLHFNTERFGEYSSNFVMECVRGDKVSMLPGGSVQTLNLKSPLMQGITKHKEYFLVPDEAILPLNWDKFFANPTIGDDVPDDCGTGVVDFWDKVSSVCSSLYLKLLDVLADSNVAGSSKLTAFYRTFVFLEMFYSDGSLISVLGDNGSKYCYFSHSSGAALFTLDRFFDQAVNKVAVELENQYQLRAIPFVTADGIRAYSTGGLQNDYVNNVSWAITSLRGFLSYLRDDFDVHISDDTTLSEIIALNAVPQSYWDGIVTYLSAFSPSFSTPGVPYNIKRLAAYQIVCCHYFTNDFVDYVYSAELYRQLIQYSVSTVLGGTSQIVASQFSVNGLKYAYDALSAKNVTFMLSTAGGSPYSFLCTQSTFYSALRGYFSNLFSFRRSLRYLDYFTGSRTRPLAVGNTGVAVNNNIVDVVDITRSTMLQKFLNAVNRFGRKFEDYLKGMEDGAVHQDYHNPLTLARTADTIYGSDTENTNNVNLSQAQTTVSRLLSNDNRYQFEFEVDRPCVVIGIVYYDIRRAYLWATDRQLFHVNRFDMFNEFMQFIGDQQVGFNELGRRHVITTSNVPFGYQLRHMEYKQRFDRATGGFVNNLPGFVFTSRDDDSRLEVSNPVQNPDYIRSLCVELDPFFVSLTGLSLGTYWHFICENNNQCDPSRPMAYAPSILG